MKERQLDSTFIRVERDGKFFNRCLSDCSWEEVESWLNQKPKECAIRTLKEFHRILRVIGDELDITGEICE